MEALKSVQEKMFQYKEGKVIVSSRNYEYSAAVIVGEDSIFMVNSGANNGISITKNGIAIQGSVTMSASGKSITKGHYSENPASYKLFTYPETVYIESLARELAYNSLGKSSGADTSSVIGNGKMPIITDISAGPLPHTHTISMKHVHRLEPAYLYRIPAMVNVFKNFKSLFNEFLSS